MKLHKKINLTCIILLIVIFSACQKVINVNLNSTAPRYVIQGNVTNQAPPYLVNITRSVNFNQDNVFPTVSGALVIITDMTVNKADTLKEITPGNYYTNITNGIPGHTYQLYINADNNIFTASSTIPILVTLDSLYTQPSIFGNGTDLVPVYTDAIAFMNYYYHFVEVRNDTLTDDIYIRNDDQSSMQVVKQPLDEGGGNLMSGDSVTLSMECIDSTIYQYYFTLRQTQNQNSATPANPISNITGGALGYFSAHTSSSKSIVVP